MTGPRDWSPPGYWDDPPTTSTSQRTSTYRQPLYQAPVAARYRRSSSTGILSIGSVLLGLAACIAPLIFPTSREGARGFIVTSVGVMAISFALTAIRRRQCEGRGGGIMATSGVVLGVAGTALCLWSVLAFYVPSVPSPPHFAFSALNTDSPRSVVLEYKGEALVDAPQQAAPAGKADETDSRRQSVASQVLGVAVGLCSELSGVEASSDYHGKAVAGVPRELSISADRAVVGENSTFGVLPDGMDLAYRLNEAGEFSLTVRHTETGIGAGCNSGDEYVTLR